MISHQRNEFSRSLWVWNYFASNTHSFIYCEKECSRLYVTFETNYSSYVSFVPKKRKVEEIKKQEREIPKKNFVWEKSSWIFFPTFFLQKIFPSLIKMPPNFLWITSIKLWTSWSLFISKLPIGDRKNIFWNFSHESWNN